MGEVTQSDIYALERRIDTVERLTAELGNIAETINRNLGSLNYSVGQVDSKLVRLAQDFQIFFPVVILSMKIGQSQSGSIFKIRNRYPIVFFYLLQKLIKAHQFLLE